MTPKELKQLFGEGNKDGVLPVLGISFCWDTPQHPDPRGKQLATVAAALEREMPKYAALGFTDMGVFWGLRCPPRSPPNRAPWHRASPRVARRLGVALPKGPGAL